MLDYGFIATIVAIALVLGTGWFVSCDEQQVPSRSVTNRRSIVRLGLVLGAAFAGIVVRLVGITVTNADQVADRRGIAPDGDTLSNPRRIRTQLAARRDRILDRNGNPLAYSERDAGNSVRIYPVHEAAHLLGYFSPLRFGTAGTEDARNGTLSGSDPLTITEALEVGLLARTLPGHDARLTIDLELQRLAGSLLTGYAGSIVLLDHRSGAILAMASSPSYDPQSLNAATESEAKRADAAWAELQTSTDHPLLFRATSGLYPPGSTFKVLVAAAAIDAGLADPGTMYTDEGSIVIDGYVIPDYARPDTGQTEWSMREGIEWSLNVVFAQIGLQVGPERLRDYANRFGIGSPVPFELPTATGQLASTPSALDARPLLAATSFGQGELLVTPLHMALVMAAVANRGVIMRPQRVNAVLSADGDEVTAVESREKSKPITSATAATMLDVLYDSVTYGYASGAQIADLRVAGKTGTAESGSDQPHSWFIGSAGVDEPVVTAAVAIDFGGEGGGVAAHIARQMMDAAVTR